jgi:hypothetical protein
LRRRRTVCFTDSNANTCCNTNSGYAVTYSDAYANSHAYTNTDPNSNPYAYTNSYSDSYSYTNADTDAYSNTYSYAHSNSSCWNAYRHVCGDSYCDCSLRRKPIRELQPDCAVSFELATVHGCKKKPSMSNHAGFFVCKTKTRGGNWLPTDSRLLHVFVKVKVYAKFVSRFHFPIKTAQNQQKQCLLEMSVYVTMWL